MRISQHRWEDGGTSRTLSILSGSGIEDCDKSADAFRVALDELAALRKEFRASEGDPERLRQEARAQARAAGAKGGKPDKKYRKKIAAAREALEDLQLDAEAKTAEVNALAEEHRQSIEEHATDLFERAKLGAQAAIHEVTSASAIATRGGSAVTANLTIMASLGDLIEVGSFVPRAPRLRRQGGDDFFQGSSPEPYVGEAAASLGKAISFSNRIMDDLLAEAQRRNRLAKIDAEVEDSPDLDDDEDDDDD